MHHDEIRFPAPRGARDTAGVDGDAVMGEVDAAIDRFIGGPSTRIGRTRTEGDANEAAAEREWQAVVVGNSDDVAAAANMLDRLNAMSAGQWNIDEGRTKSSGWAEAVADGILWPWSGGSTLPPGVQPTSPGGDVHREGGTA